MKGRFPTAALLLCGLLAISSCAESDVAYVRQMPIYDVDLQTVPDGTHTGSFACGGFTYVVQTTVTNHRIEKIDVLSNRKTARAVKAEEVLARVIARQTPNVDAVAGAAIISRALLKAVENSLTIRSRR